LFRSAAPSHAQVAIVVRVGPAYVGPAPVCAYGYYGYYPYACAPYGYYGPSWFSGGLFIGAGPWVRGGLRRRFDRGFGGRGFDRGFGNRGFGNRGFAGRGSVGGGFHGGSRGGSVHGGGSFH